MTSHPDTAPTPPQHRPDTTLLSHQLKQHEFREKFRREAPFSFSDPDPYKSLNKVLMHCGKVPVAVPGTPLECWIFLSLYSHKWKWTVLPGGVASCP